MQALTIFHKKRHRNVWLILGVLMLLLGVGAYFYDQSELGFNFGIGIVYLLLVCITHLDLMLEFRTIIYGQVLTLLEK